MTTLRAPEIANGTITSWLPLVTPGPITQQAKCSSAMYFLPGVTSELLAFDPYYGKWIDTQVRCLASEQTAWWHQHSDGVTSDLNLGPFACPAGYTTAATSSINAISTFVGCCPNSYKYGGTLLGPNTAGQCMSSLSSGQIVVAKTAVSGLNWLDTSAVMGPGLLSVTGCHVNGFIFNEKALTSPATTFAITTPSVTSTSGSSVPTSATSTSTTFPSASSTTSSQPAIYQTGLNKGARIGIGVGFSVLIIALLALVALLFIRKCRSRHVTAEGFKAAAESSRLQEPFYSPSKATQAPEASGMSGDNKQIYETPAELWVHPSQGG
ncbi:hypothetical protein B0J14DRAFT_674648 [Halenospora varia]|nr:hypothetical protein B0J14DRAFT_674648 [Halenospora varia]